MDDFQEGFISELCQVYRIPNDYLDSTPITYHMIQHFRDFPMDSTCTPSRNEITGNNLRGESYRNIRYWDEPIECPEWPVREILEVTQC